MNEGTLEGGGQSKNAALIEAVNEISENLLSDPNMDIRIGMVNFIIIVQSSITRNKSVRTSFR